MNTRFALACALAILVGSPGCGDNTNATPDASAAADAAVNLDAGPPDGDAGSAPDAGDGAEPSAAIVFPPRSALTTEDSILVRGTAADDGAVTAVYVNGVSATTTDGYASWQAAVPLATGANEAVVEVHDDAGQVVAEAARVQVIRWLPLNTPADLAVDGVERLAYVADFGHAAILAVHLDTGLTRLLSGGGVGAGPALQAPRSVVLDDTGDRLYVLDGATRNVLAVDVATGDRVVLSGTGVGSGTSWNAPQAIALNPTDGNLLLIDNAAPALFEIDITTGDRTIRSSSAVGSGPLFADPRDVTFDPLTAQAVVVNRGSGQLLRVSLTSGVRTLITNLGAAEAPTAVHAGPLPGEVLVLEALGYVLRRVEVTTGTSEIIASSYVDFGLAYGSGLLYGDIQSVAMDDLNGHALVLDDFRDTIIDTDVTTGYSRPPWYGNGGSLIVSPYAAALDAANGRIVVADEGMDSVVAIDVATGAQSVLAGPASDDALAFRVPQALHVTQNGARAFVTDAIDWDFDDWDTRFMEIDLQTGARTIVAERTHGTGPRPKDMTDFLLETQSDRAWVTQQGGAYKCELESGILEVQLSTGDRSWLGANDDCGDWSVGGGVDTRYLTGVVPGSSGQTLWALDVSLHQIVAFDRTTGDRAQVFDLLSAGDGPPINGWGMVLDNAHDRLLVVSSYELLAVDRTTGARTLLSGPSMGAGPGIPQYRGEVALDSAPEVALVVAPGRMHGVIMIDTVTGERASVGYSVSP